jgi:hypothetical protein
MCRRPIFFSLRGWTYGWLGQLITEITAFTYWVNVRLKFTRYYKYIVTNRTDFQVAVSHPYNSVTIRTLNNGHLAIPRNPLYPYLLIKTQNHPSNLRLFPEGISPQKNTKILKKTRLGGEQNYESPTRFRGR